MLSRLQTQCLLSLKHHAPTLDKEVRKMKKYVAPEAELVLLDTPNVMLEVSDENSLFVDVFEK